MVRFSLGRVLLVYMVVPALVVGVPAGGVSHEPPRPLEGRALEDFVAFTRLLGYVRFFHPSDEVLERALEIVRP